MPDNLTIGRAYPAQGGRPLPEGFIRKGGRNTDADATRPPAPAPFKPNGMELMLSMDATTVLGDIERIRLKLVEVRVEAERTAAAVRAATL